MHNPLVDSEICKVVRQVAFDECHLDLLDDEIEKEKTKLADLLKESSKMKKSFKHDKILSTDIIELVEKLEMESHTTSMRLAAWAVERSRLVRTVLRKSASIRGLRSEVDSYGRDGDNRYYNACLQELWAKNKICMNKKCVLEEHVETEGNVEVAYVLQPGSKARVDEERLENYMDGRDGELSGRGTL